jgi:hypothetical protein
MNVPIPLRWWRAAAFGLAALPGVATAQDRDPFAPAPPKNVRTVEVLHGATRVWPPPRPAPVVQPAPVVPPPRVTEEKPPAPPPLPPPVQVSFPPIVIQTTAAEPAPPRPAEPITIYLSNYTTEAPKPQGVAPPAAPWLGATPFEVPPLPAPPAPVPVAPAGNPVTQASATTAAPTPAPTPAAPAAPATPPQPTVVVIREPAGEARPAPVADAPRGVTLTNEVLFGLGVGVVGLGVGLAGWRRRPAPPPPPPAPRVIAPPLTGPAGDGVMLLGRYNAGPIPTTAERFDMGPSYEAERQEKKKVEEKNQEAVLEFILSQNLALHAELAGPATTPAEDELPEAVELNPADQTPGPDAA